MCEPERKPDITDGLVAIPAAIPSSKPTVDDINSSNSNSYNYSKEQQLIIESQDNKIQFLESQLRSISDDLDNGKIPQKNTIEQLIREIQLLKADNVKLSTKNTNLLAELEKQANEIQKAMSELISIEAQNADLILKLKEANENIESKNDIIENRDAIIKSKDKQLDKINDKLVEAKVYKKWVLGVAGSVGILLIIGFAMKTAKPF